MNKNAVKTDLDWLYFLYVLTFLLSVTGNINIHPVWVLMPVFVVAVFYAMELIAYGSILIGPIGMIIIFILQFVYRHYMI